MKLPITIDPRYYDAVLFDLDSALTNRDGGFALVIGVGGMSRDGPERPGTTVRFPG